MSRKRRRTTMNVGDRPRLLARNEVRYLARAAARRRGWSTRDHMPMSSQSQSTAEVRPDDQRGELCPGREKELVERCANASKASIRSVRAARPACTCSIARSRDGLEGGLGCILGILGITA